MVNEAFGYTHDQTLDSPFTLISSMLREYNFALNERNKAYESLNEEDLEDGEEWVHITDFMTGKKKRIKRVNMI